MKNFLDQIDALDEAIKNIKNIVVDLTPTKTDPEYKSKRKSAIFILQRVREIEKNKEELSTIYDRFLKEKDI